MSITKLPNGTYPSVQNIRTCVIDISIHICTNISNEKLVANFQNKKDFNNLFVL